MKLKSMGLKNVHKIENFQLNRSTWFYNID